MPKRSSRRRGINLLAKSIVDDAITEKLLDKAVGEGKNPAAVYLGRLGGLKGGRARAAKLSARKRSEIAKKAAQSRWHEQ